MVYLWGVDVFMFFFSLTVFLFCIWVWHVLPHTRLISINWLLMFVDTDFSFLCKDLNMRRASNLNKSWCGDIYPWTHGQKKDIEIILSSVFRLCIWNAFGIYFGSSQHIHQRHTNEPVFVFSERRLVVVLWRRFNHFDRGLHS